MDEVLDIGEGRIRETSKEVIIKSQVKDDDLRQGAREEMVRISQTLCILMTRICCKLHVSCNKREELRMVLS